MTAKVKNVALKIRKSLFNFMDFIGVSSMSIIVVFCVSVIFIEFSIGKFFESLFSFSEQARKIFQSKKKHCCNPQISGEEESRYYNIISEVIDDYYLMRRRLFEINRSITIENFLDARNEIESIIPLLEFADNRCRIIGLSREDYPLLSDIARKIIETHCDIKGDDDGIGSRA